MQEFEGRGASEPGCYSHLANTALETLSVPTDRAARIDYTSPPTASAGTLSWIVDRPLMAVEASFVDLAREARDARNFALSATAFGFAAATAPLGLERLDRPRRARRRSSKDGQQISYTRSTVGADCS